MVALRVRASAIYATVRTLTRPSATRIATPGSGPITATAIGSATTVEPTVSVTVSEYAVQNGDMSSSRAFSRARAQRRRSSGGGRSTYTLSSGCEYSVSYAAATRG